MELFHVLSTLEANDDVHLARLLVLLRAFVGRDNTGTIVGLTKLAKLDFLLRYPVYLEKALQAKQLSVDKVEVADHERISVESTMVRFLYGPWDYRYRRFVNLLVSRGLAKISIDGKTVEISLTQEGVKKANMLVNDEAFRDTVRRAKLLKHHFDNRGTYLARFIYQTFPEIATLRLGQVIYS